MANDQQRLLYLFELPQEDIQKPRGGGSVLFKFENDETPPSVATRVGVSPSVNLPVPERNDVTLQALGTAPSIPKGSAFSFFLASHRRAAKDLCDFFMKTSGAEDLRQVAARVHGKVNETLFIYAISFVILRKKELRSVRLPTMVEVFPSRFVPQEALAKAQLEINRMDPNQTEPVIIDHGLEFSGTHLKPEHRLSYWREDNGINVHHWHWHLIYPPAMGFDRDRKGELFYYMHQQIIARYDIERLCLGLPRVEKLDNWRIPIEDGYFPKLTISNSGRQWGSRQDNTLPKDLRRRDFGEFVDITDMEIWRSRLLDAIHQGFMIDRNGDKVRIRDDVTSGKRGIEILSEALEADAELSVNFPYYGDLHNRGHDILAFSHDPDNAHKEEMGVVGDLGTSLRDPVFFRLHKLVDDLFQEYKETQQPYTESELFLPGVRIEQAGVVRGNEADVLLTGWNKREFEASRGLDFNGKSVILRLTHLDHKPFEYHMQINNDLREAKEVTVRIFLAPKLNGQEKEMDFIEQRILWSEMDKFTVNLKPGKNHVVRSSKESSITNLEELTFKDLENSGPGSTSEQVAFNFCGCGWPQHMLLPRGRPEGMAFQLFFMLTDYAKDKVANPGGVRRCANGVSFCGMQDAKYPDARPMGFPFDRPPAPLLQGLPVSTTADYARLGNAFIHDITIRFLGEKLN
uniref:Prophenoloxidase n=1 Tax=Penaeus merguiensis TaxID=71412 RepID=A0A075C1R0_PENME|nr:prophenoloxidase [Penaeus merguiensis]